ncbi:hypothetical protein MANES_10G065902v8 [Manihot esculenta]|uniref:Uncharacterized protein n=1 Tax=Manihot esculenta TaxID=3983 RepID=A0ACB7H129_MANES|nr:hypothetical protein MANES_10G065902v8 [Manihot esculenta]
MNLLSWNCRGLENPLTVHNLQGICNSKLDGKVFKFRQFVDRLQLIDISFKGPPTTWNNRREGIYNIRERLDRCLATHQWLLHYPTATVQNLEDLGFDHRPLWVTFKPPYAKAKQYFKFD